MTQIIVINDTGAQIAAGATITLDDVNVADPIEAITKASLLNLYNAAATLASATATIIAATLTYGAGDFVYLDAINKIRLGVAMETYQILVLNVRTRGEIVRA